MMRMAPAILSGQIAAATRLAGLTEGFFPLPGLAKSLFRGEDTKRNLKHVKDRAANLAERQISAPIDASGVDDSGYHG
jgi:hypothetical protein